MTTRDPEMELLEKEILCEEITFLRAFTPDVFCCANGVGYVQAWKGNLHFWIECKGASGEYFTRKFSGITNMVSVCSNYFSALCAGYPLLGV